VSEGPLVWRDGDPGPTTETAPADTPETGRVFTNWRDMVIADQAAEIAELSATLGATSATLARTETLLFQRTDALNDAEAKIRGYLDQMRLAQRANALEVASLTGQIEALRQHVVNQRFTVVRNGVQYTFKATPAVMQRLDAMLADSPGYAKVMWEQIQAGLAAGSIVKEAPEKAVAPEKVKRPSRQVPGEEIER
jgi:hypothetical protein